MKKTERICAIRRKSRSCAKWFPAFGLLIGINLVSDTACGLSIRAYSAARHDRFASGYPANPVVNTNFYADYHDSSGVGWNAANPNQSFALISPRHFVGANHFKPGVGATIVFQGRDGALRSYTVAAQFNITNDAGQSSDLFIGELSQSVATCDNITFYPILDAGSEAAYAGRELLVYGRTARAGRGSIGAFQDFGGDPITGGAGINSTRTYSFSYLNAAGSSDDCHAEGGDSGSPSFVATNGELFVVGVHTAVLTTPVNVTTYDTFVPHYLDQINAILGQQGFRAATTPNEVFRLCHKIVHLPPDDYLNSWVGHRRRVYQLEAGTNLFNFVAVSGLLTANVATVSFIDSNSVDRVKFYRVRRVEEP